jgi:hypothetical protein
VRVEPASAFLLRKVLAKLEWDEWDSTFFSAKTNKT